MQLEKPAAQPTPRANDVWQVVEVAASRVPAWVFRTPIQAKELMVKIAGGNVIVIGAIDE